MSMISFDREAVTAVTLMAFDGEMNRRRTPDGNPLDFETAWWVFMLSPQSEDGEVRRILERRAWLSEMSLNEGKEAVRELFELLVSDHPTSRPRN